MKVAVRYQSRGGNTKAAAEYIANALDTVAEPIDAGVDEGTDLLIIGGGMYAFSLDEGLSAFLAGPEPVKAKEAAVFTTAGFISGTKKIKAPLEKRGVKCADESLALKLGMKNYGGKNGALAFEEKHKSKMDKFAKDLMDR